MDVAVANGLRNSCASLIDNCESNSARRKRLDVGCYSTGVPLTTSAENSVNDAVALQLWWPWTTGEKNQTDEADEWERQIERETEW